VSSYCNMLYLVLQFLSLDKLTFLQFNDLTCDCDRIRGVGKMRLLRLRLVTYVTLRKSNP